MSQPGSYTPLETELLYATSTPDGTLVYRDDVWGRIFGRGGDPWRKLDENDTLQVEECVKEAAAGALVTQQLFFVNTPDRKDPLPVLLNFFPVHAPQQKNVLSITITGEALVEPVSWTASQTQRHRFEELGRMTMGIAHDFNNLLSGILGYTELLTSEFKEREDDSILLDHLSTIEKAALDGAGLITKIQEYIRQEKKTRFEPLFLPDLIEDCISLTRPYWYKEPRRQGIDINMETEFNEVPHIEGSPTELREVFVNLILNAVQAMPNGGRIAFRTEHQTDHSVVVSMMDTGTGMSDEVKEHLFEPLFTTKGDQGTGMGLAVSYGIIQEHEGTIEVASSLGKGTTFTLSFPPADAALPETLLAEEERSTKTGSILVVDDEQMVRSVLQKLLSLNGHAVSEAASGAEALSLVDEQEFDLVFTDHGMPNMNGRELARALRRRLPHLPIILLTGDTEIAEAGEHVDAIVEKPFQVDNLESLIQDLI